MPKNNDLKHLGYGQSTGPNDHLLSLSQYQLKLWCALGSLQRRDSRPDYLKLGLI